jgi:hypothetical protein
LIYDSIRYGSYNAVRKPRGNSLGLGSPVSGIAAELNPIPVTLHYNELHTVITGPNLIDRFTYTVPDYRRLLIQSAIAEIGSLAATGTWFDEISILRKGIPDTLVIIAPAGPLEPTRTNRHKIVQRHRYGGFGDPLPIIDTHNGQLELYAGDKIFGSTHWDGGAGTMRFILSALCIEFDEKAHT